MSEIWNFNIDIIKKEFNNYNFSYEVPENSKIGGIAILIKKNIKILNITKDNSYEKIELISSQILVNNIKVTIVGIYRHPNQNLNNMNESLKKISNDNKNLIIMGDLNINLLNVSNGVNNYSNNIFSNNLINHINHPTRIAANSKTLIDHIYTKGNNINKRKIHTGILITDITDHYATFIIISNSKVTKKEKPYIRIFSKKIYTTINKKLIHLIGIIYQMRKLKLAIHASISQKISAMYSMNPFL